MSKQGGTTRSSLQQQGNRTKKSKKPIKKESISDLRKNILGSKYDDEEEDLSSGAADFFNVFSPIEAQAASHNVKKTIRSNQSPLSSANRRVTKHDSDDESYLKIRQDRDLVPVTYEPVVKRDLSKLFGKIRIKEEERRRMEEQENFFFTDDSTLQNNAEDENLLSTNHGDIEMPEKTEEDEWVDLLEYCKKQLSDIKVGVFKLKSLHQQHVKFTVQKNFQAEEQEIKIQTDYVKQLIAQSKKSIDKFDSYAKVARRRKKTQFETLVNNAKKSLLTDLSNLSTDLQHEQRSFLDKLTQLKTKRKELQRIHQNEQVEEFSKEELERMEAIEQRFYEPNVSEEQMHDLMLREREIIKRDQELRFVSNICNIILLTL